MKNTDLVEYTALEGGDVDASAMIPGRVIGSNVLERVVVEIEGRAGSGPP